MDFKKRICVVGLGYIGLPSAALLANRGYFVHGVDISKDVVDTINEGKIHIVEPDLDSFVHSAVNSRHLKASLKPLPADIFIISVPTPFHEGYVPNIDHVLDATRSIANVVEPGNIVILESTSPVGTTEKVASVLEQSGVNLDEVYIAHCPERVLPGKIMQELVGNDRIVGGINALSSQKAAEFYKTFVNGEVLVTDARTAEMAKLTENSFRDVNIAFANELSILCDKFDINVWELLRLANRHPRVNILKPGCGVGGHCIAVDPWFIVHKGGEDAHLIRSAREINNRKTQWSVDKIVEKIDSLTQERGQKPLVACMGLSFKPDIDDLRESPALDIYQRLVALGVTPLAVEPNLDDHPCISLSSYNYAATHADLVVYLVAHREFNGLTLSGEVLDFCGVTNK